MIVIQKAAVTIKVLYFLPDYPSIIQEFVWQTDDIFPEFPRTIQFLTFWRNNIISPIKDVYVCIGDGNFKKLDIELEIR